jgi:putative oxidoreductase
MNTTLWITQIILSIMMLVVGFMKTFFPINKLNKFSWTVRRSKAFVRFVGISEVLIGIGLILPVWTGILPVLTGYAALSVCTIMILAIVEHIQNNELYEIWKNVMIILLAGFVTVGRLMLL